MKFPERLPANSNKNSTPCAVSSFVTIRLLLVSNRTTVTMMLKWSRYPSKGPAHNTSPSSLFNSSLFSLSNSSLFSSPPLNSSLFSSLPLNSNPSSSSLSSSNLPPNSSSSSSNSSNGPNSIPRVSLDFQCSKCSKTKSGALSKSLSGPKTSKLC
jgi:hypothetical protein